MPDSSHDAESEKSSWLNVVTCHHRLGFHKHVTQHVRFQERRGWRSRLPKGRWSDSAQGLPFYLPSRLPVAGGLPRPPGIYNLCKFTASKSEAARAAHQTQCSGGGGVVGACSQGPLPSPLLPAVRPRGEPVQQLRCHVADRVHEEGLANCISLPRTASALRQPAPGPRGGRSQTGRGRLQKAPEKGRRRESGESAPDPARRRHTVRTRSRGSCRCTFRGWRA